MTDAILKESLKIISHHFFEENGVKHNEIETFYRLAFKAVNGINPPFSNPNQLFIDLNKVVSSRETKTVQELHNLKEAMPKKHYKIGSQSAGQPIVIIKYKNEPYLIDGSTRINDLFFAHKFNEIISINIHDLGM